MLETKSIQEILNSLKVNQENGLTSIEAKKRLEKDGLNKLPEKKKQSRFVLFLKQFHDPMIYILLAAAIISFVVGLIQSHLDLSETIIILAIVLLNAIVGFVQEVRAENALEALKKLSAPTCFVRRDKEVKEIKVEELVKGDIVILESGTLIGADIRLLTSFNLRTDESSLTGESLPIEKDHKIVFSSAVGVGDRLNTVYMSTPVVYGHGEGVVIKTGEETEIGQIAKMIVSENEQLTPLQKRLAEFSKLLGIIAIVIIAAIFAISLFQKRDLLEMFMTGISLAVAAVPEGLPAVVTIVLALGVQRMVKVNTIVKRLPSVETLGSVSVVCSDKTGTLTENKMSVVSSYVDEQFFDEVDFKNESLNFLTKGLALCTNASIDEGIYGDPTEIALLDYAKLYGLSKSELEKTYPRQNELPFDSKRKMMSTQHLINDELIVFTKGALDHLLKKITHILINNQTRKITKEDIKRINEANMKMTLQALRVLALAYKSSNQLSEDNLVFVGLVGMKDPARFEAKPAVEKFKMAGIKTIMITGDHKHTAFAIAKELNIASDISEVVTGEELAIMDFLRLQEVVKTARVFARVSPENKVDIVKAFKANGEIVAMTGDGVNDAPSLMSADIGIAMGITGTDVAKEASDMVLSDDNFASIEKAVEEGRSIYANVKKTIYFLLSSNIGEVISMFVAIILRLPLPLIARHILWVNLVTDGFPAIALGADEKDPHIMLEKPRAKDESLFARGGFALILFYGIVIAFITIIGFLLFPAIHIVENGMSFTLSTFKEVYEFEGMLRLSQSMAFSVLGVSQLFHMLGMVNTKRSVFRLFKSKNYLILISFVFGLGMQILITEVAFLENFFITANLTFIEWLYIIALAIIPLVIHEIIVFFLFIKGKIQKRKNKLVLQ